MKPDRSHNDWIALALVGVLAFLLALIAAATLSGHPLGEEAWVTAAAIVGAVAGYLTAGRSHTPQTPAPAEQISTGEEPSGLDPTPPDPAAPLVVDEHPLGPEAVTVEVEQDAIDMSSPYTSATEATPIDESGYDDVTGQFTAGGPSTISEENYK
jgi:hypothetical protein